MSEPHATWREGWASRVRTEDDLVRFVDAVGCCTINPLPAWPGFPSQAVAMGRDDALGQTWFWKDDLHNQRRLWYTRVFAGRPGFLSLALLPTVIAACGEVLDELELSGGLPVETLALARFIEAYGPISTIQIKKMLGEDARRGVAAGLIELERRFIITKVDLAGREMNTYSYVWDMAERFVPAAFAAATLSRRAARAHLLDHLRALGCEPTPLFCTRVLRWTV